MAFTLPSFNLTVNIYSGGATLPAGGPRVVTTGNLQGGRMQYPVGTMQAVQTAPQSPANFFQHVLLLPRGTDIRTNISGGGVVYSDFVRLPIYETDGRVRWWCVMDMGDVAKGFPNEYRRAFISPLAWPLVFPIP